MDRHYLWQRIPRDGGCQCNAKPVRRTPPNMSPIGQRSRTNIATISSAPLHLATITWTSMCHALDTCKDSQHHARTPLLPHSRLTSQTYTTRMLSACFWIVITTLKHQLTSFQYQVFQDLQGPASSLRVGSSVRTSTRPLSVSLLRLCLRYLTCIQRR